MIAKGFKKRKVHSLTLGEKMKKMRSTKRVHLQQVARHTKIQVRYLEALEEGAYNDLPADVYVHGFLKSYADYFGVNDVTLIRLYDRERGIYNSISVDSTGMVTQQKPLKVKRFIVTPRIMLVTFGVVLFGIVFFYLYSELRHFVSAPWLIVDNPTDGMTIADRVVTVNGKTDRDARIFVNAHDVIVNQDGSFEEIISLQNGVNTIVVKSINSFDKESEQIITVYGQYEDAQEEQRENKVFVTVTADKADIIVSVRADDRVIFDDKILSEETQTFEALEEISITTSHGDATLVSVNDREYGLLGETNEEVEGMIFTENTAVEIDDVAVEENEDSLDDESVQ